MPKRALANPESAEVQRELQQSEALLKSRTPGLEALNLRTWYDAFREAATPTSSRIASPPTA